jgi:hypothetical protein
MPMWLRPNDIAAVVNGVGMSTVMDGPPPLSAFCLLVLPSSGQLVGFVPHDFRGQVAIHECASTDENAKGFTLEPI